MIVWGQFIKYRAGLLLLINEIAGLFIALQLGGQHAGQVH